MTEGGWRGKKDKEKGGGRKRKGRGKGDKASPN